VAKRLFDYHNEEDVRLPVLIKSAEVRVAKNGKKFIAMIFQDNSGHISGKFWDATENDIAQFKAGAAVRKAGTVSRQPADQDLLNALGNSRRRK
jgi:3'-5' exoribonuclease